jgi:hypothetical protein
MPLSTKQNLMSSNIYFNSISCNKFNYLAQHPVLLLLPQAQPQPDHLLLVHMAGFLIAQINTTCSFTTTYQINLQLKIEVPVFKQAKSTIHM